ncbi:MAG: hypothetical protein QOJ44_180 [Acidimicrobiaceae bacterium]|jgi:hypothetical protein|nr:hypothetical protein [Acidimicrobiaceae bacterium]
MVFDLEAIGLPFGYSYAAEDCERRFAFAKARQQAIGAIWGVVRR